MTKLLIKNKDKLALMTVLLGHYLNVAYNTYITFILYDDREKISELVDFPIRGLDLSSYVKGPQDLRAPPVYDLYAVSQHSGGLGGGHYTAVCKNHIDNNWYERRTVIIGQSKSSVPSFSSYLTILCVFFYPFLSIFRYNFNDSFVSETTPESAINEMAYVLFYKRREGTQRWAGIKPLDGDGLPDEAS
jgi:Ubiquitin carboxyl-terminal hydrolase